MCCCFRVCEQQASCTKTGHRKSQLHFAKEIIQKELDANKLQKSYICEGKTFADLYITDVLQGLINDGVKVSPVWVNGGWVEIDTVSDLRLAEKLTKQKESYLFVDR